MIEGLDNLLIETDQPGLAELRLYLAEMFAAEGKSGRITNVSKLLRSRVFRVTAELDDAERSFVIKRFTPELAYKEKRVVERWLPRIDMAEYGPPLLGAAAEQSGRCVWHVYEDLGPWTLDQQMADAACVEVATRQVANIHMRGTEHAVLAECRCAGEDFGMGFYESSVRDGIRNLMAIKSHAETLQPQQLRLLDKLLAKFDELWVLRNYRAEALANLGSPETLLHGDLWTTNIFVMPGDELQARLIDWDHIGVGQITYDLSTYLLRFPIEQRQKVLDCYQAEVAALNWELPSAEDFNLLCETAELARLATATLWSAINAYEHPTDWAFAELSEISQWFENLKPLLPVDAAYEQASGS
jgi:hypothetical protein